MSDTENTVEITVNVSVLRDAPDTNRCIEVIASEANNVVCVGLSCEDAAQLRDDLNVALGCVTT